MADKVEGRDAVGWKAQWDQLKAELDKLNPAHDAAKHKCSEQSTQIADMQKQIDADAATIASLQAKLQETAEQRALGSVLSLATQCENALTVLLRKMGK